MKIEIYEKGLYQVIRIGGPFKAISQLEELQALIEMYLKRGRAHIAVNFTDASYLYSGALSVLVQCFKRTRELGGDLCILEPNPGLLKLLDQMNLHSLLTILKTEDDLPAVPPEIRSRLEREREGSKETDSPD